MITLCKTAPPERLVGNHETGDVLAPLRRLMKKYENKAWYIASTASDSVNASRAIIFNWRAAGAIDAMLA